MQRRLFIILFPMMFLPAVGVMLLDWQRGRDHLAMLEGPGLVRSTEASLELARRVLDAQKLSLEERARLLAADPSAPLPEDTCRRVWLLEEAGTWVATGGDTSEVPDYLRGLSGADLAAAFRVPGSRPPLLVAGFPLPENPARYVVVERTLDPQLATLLEDITRGGAGVRQLALVYRKLLLSDLLLSLAVLALFLLLLSLLLSHLIARSLARPLRLLVQGTQKVAAGDLDHRIEAEAPAELGTLVEAFNGMTAELKTGREDLRRAERVAAWQGVARRLAHEIKNPLTPITLAMHRIKGKSEDATVQSCVRTVLEEAGNLGRLADEFSMYAKLPRPAPADLAAEDLRRLLDDVARFYLARTRVTYRWEGWPRDFVWRVDIGQLRQVLSNLIKNGNEAMGGEGELLFCLEEGSAPSTEDGRAWWRLKIADSGPGLPEDIEAVFEPYHTSKPTGTGLGLAVSRRIIEDNGGRLTAANTGRGAVFAIDLPAAERNSA